MEVSLLLMQQIVQLFIVLLMGYVVVKAGLLKASDSKVLSVVFVYLVMPCVVLNAFQIDDTPQIRTGLLYSMDIEVGMHVVFLVLSFWSSMPSLKGRLNWMSWSRSTSYTAMLPHLSSLWFRLYSARNMSYIPVLSSSYS